MPTLADLKADIAAYTTYDEPAFVASFNRFIQASEERIWYFVQLPNFRKNVTGAFTAGSQYLELPSDFLAPASLAVIMPVGSPQEGDYVYLLNKDVNYIRETFPNPNVQGVPSHYAIFDADAMNTAIIVGKTPDVDYAAELHYFYRPASLTLDDNDANTTWLSVHAYDTLLYGSLVEAANWMKRTAGIDAMGDVYEQRFLVGLQGLKNLGEARDRKDVYRSGEKRSAE